MDDALARLKSWQRKHQLQMASARASGESRLRDFEQLCLQPRHASRSAAESPPRRPRTAAPADGHAAADFSAAAERPCSAHARLTPAAQDCSGSKASRDPREPEAPEGAAAPRARHLRPEELELLRWSSRLNFAGGVSRARRQPPTSADPETAKLLQGLEAELSEMERGTSRDDLTAWGADLQSVLGRMDALQSGYQARDGAPE